MKYRLPLNIVLILIVTILWGFNFVFVKIALQHFEPFTMLTLRFIIAAAMLIPFFPKIPIHPFKLLRITATFTLLHLGTMFWGVKLGLDAAIGVVVMQTHVPFLLLIGIIFFKEHIGWKSLLGITCAIIGSALLMNAPNSINHTGAFWLMMASAFCVSLYSAQLKVIKDINAIALIAWIALFSIPMLLPFALLLETSHLESIMTANIKTISALLYVAIGSSVIAHSLWAYLLSKSDIISFAPITLLVPVIGIFGGIIFLDEAISSNMIIGTVTILVGVGIIIHRRPKLMKTDIDA